MLHTDNTSLQLKQPMNSNTLAPSATLLTPSGQTEENFPFAASVQMAMQRQVKAQSMTRERQMLNRGKLVSAVCADYRCHFASIYGKTERLPTAVFNKVETYVDEAINATLRAVHPMNAVSMRRAFKHKSNDMMFVESVTVSGENLITLKEQHLACNIAIGEANKRLTVLQAKNTPDFDREKAVKQQLMKLQLTLNFIEGEMQNQATVTPAS